MKKVLMHDRAESAWQSQVDQVLAALAHDRCNPYLWSDYGGLLLMLGQPEKAIEPLQQAIIYGPDLAAPYSNLAEGLFRLGSWRSSARAAQKGIACYQHVRPDVADAPGSSDQHRDHRADQDLQDRGNLAYLYHLAGLASFNSGHFSEALVLVQAALDLDPNALNVRISLVNTAVQERNLAIAAPHLPVEIDRDRDFLEALERFSLARAADPEGGKRSRGRLDLLAWLRSHQPATPGQPGPALDLDPGDLAKLYRAAAMVCWSLARFTQAEVYETAATNLDGQSASPFDLKPSERDWVEHDWSQARQRYGDEPAPTQMAVSCESIADRYWLAQAPGYFSVVEPVAIVGDGGTFTAGEIPHPAAAVVELTDGHICSRPWTGLAVMTADRQILPEFSPAFPMHRRANLDQTLRDCHPFITRDQPLPRAVQVEGWAIACSGLAFNNYSHWLTEFLPAWHNLQASGCDPRAADVVVIPEYQNLSFQREILGHLGVDLNRLVNAYRAPHVQAQRLTVASLTSYITWPTPAACRLARNWLLQTYSPTGQSGLRRLYISRDRASRRHAINEPEILAVLEPLGFTRIFAEDLSLADQVNLFAGAEMIVAPHGAGLTNLLVCPEGAIVIELFAGSRQTWHAYWLMAQHVGLRYAPLVSDIPRSIALYELLHPSLNIDADIYIHPPDLLGLIDRLLV